MFSWLVFTPMNDQKQQDIQPQRNWEHGSQYLCEQLFHRVKWGSLETFRWPDPVLTGVCGAQHNVWLCRDLFHIKKHSSPLWIKEEFRGFFLPPQLNEPGKYHQEKKNKHKALEQLVNTEGFISTSHGLQQALKQDQLQFSMPRDLHGFPKTKEVLGKHCT